MKTLKKALSLTLALALTLAMAVPAFAETTDLQSREGNKITVNFLGEYDPKANENGALIAHDGGDLEGLGDVITILDPNDLAFSKAGGEYEVIYYLWENEYYNYKGTVLLSDLNGSFANLTKADGIPAGTSVDDLLWWVGDELGWWMVPGTFHGWASDYTLSATPTQPEQPTTPTQPEQPATPTDPTTPTTPATPDAPGTYTVKKGDTWSSICTNFYGTNAQRYALMKANKNVKLKEGAVITLPEKLGKDTLIPAPAAGAGEKLYTVKAGDTLGRIAAAEYGKVSEYKAIFERNADRLKNANTIYEGQVIVLPVKK